MSKVKPVSAVTKAVVIPDDPVTPEQKKVEPEPCVTVDHGKFSPEGVGTV